MSKENNDIDKINEQIQSILDEENGVYNDAETETLDDGDVVLDEKIEDNQSFDDTKEITKKLDKIEDISDTSTFDEEEKAEDINKEEVVEKTESATFKNETNDSKEDVSNSFSKPKNKKKWIIIVLVIFLLLAVILFIVFNKKDNKKTVVEKDKSLSKSEQKEIINNYGDVIRNVIVDYLEKQNVLLNYDDAIKLIEFDYDVVCWEHEIYENGDLYLNSCKIDSKKTSYSYGKKQEKSEELENVDDNSIKIYVSKSNKKTILNKPSNEADYDIYSFEIEGEYSELTLLKEYDGQYVFFYDNDMNVQMINFKTGKKALSPLNYTSILPIKEDGNYSNIVAVSINDKWGIYNVDTRERLISHKYESVTPILYIGTSGPPLYVESLENGKIAVIEDSKMGVINYNTGDEIIPVEYKYMIKSGSYLWVTDLKNNGHIFDYSGHEYLIEKYKKVYGIVNGIYTLIKDNDNSVKLIKVDGKVLYDYGKLEIGDLNYSLEYDKKATFQFYKTDSKDLDNCVDVVYNLSTKTGEIKDVDCGGIG